MTSEMFDEDHYEVLGVRETATAEQIKLAFRSKAKLLHPDLNPSVDTTDEFIRLIDSYRILHDDEQRLVFDTYRAAMEAACAPRRPYWRMAGVMVAFVVSIGAASTFGYFALGGEAGSALIAKLAPVVSTPIKTVWASSISATPAPAGSVPAKPTPEKPSPGTPAPSLPARGEVHGSLNRMAQAHIETVRVSPAHVGQPAQPRPPTTHVAAVPTAHPAASPVVRKTEDEETLVARLADSVDAPFAQPRTASGDTRGASSAGPKTQQATAVAIPARSAEQHLAPKVDDASKPVAVTAAVGPTLPHSQVLRAKAPYPVRRARPYSVRAKVYPLYPRSEARREPVERYPMPKWVTAPRAAPLDTFPF